MTARRLALAGLVLCLGPLLASCGGAENGFSAYVADHWPHWAGGMPSDVPPRPGTPGYNEFIAHGQADQGAAAPATAGKPAAVAAKKTAQPASAAAALPAVPPDGQSEDFSVTRGGLY